MNELFQLEQRFSVDRLLDTKRANFLVDYGLSSAPIIVWQCLPVGVVSVDVNNPKVVAVIRNGARGISDSGWWHGFGGGYPVPTFEGVASCSVEEAAGRVTEMHADGHFLGAVWSFPQLSDRSSKPGPAVADFYTGAFTDFVYVAAKIYEVIEYAGKLIFTCTMRQANNLPLAGNIDRILASAPLRETLRWPLTTVTNRECLSDVGIEQAAKFLGIYGRRLQRNG